MIELEVTMSKQSSIDWLVEQIKKDINLRLRGFDIDKALEQAKAMHKEDIERFNKFLNDEKKLGIADLKTIERIQWYYNTYFNETFGGQDNE